MMKLWTVLMSGVVLISSLSLVPATENVSVKGRASAAFPPDEKKMAGLLKGRYTTAPAYVARHVDSLYNQLHLEAAGLNRSVFYTALKGYSQLNSEGKLRRPGLLTICDYSQPSSNKRLYVLDLNEGKILFNTYVAHGRNTGNSMATSFSNSNESHKSSLGFMITDDTYVGSNGYSLRFDGQEKGINCQVRPRAIVMHGSDYVSAARAATGTMMGRSWGCPAVSQADHRRIIDAIKGGSCFFAYSPDAYYTQNSALLHSNYQWPELSGQKPVTLAANNALQAGGLVSVQSL